MFLAFYTFIFIYRINTTSLEPGWLLEEIVPSIHKINKRSFLGLRYGLMFMLNVRPFVQFNLTKSRKGTPNTTQHANENADQLFNNFACSCSLSSTFSYNNNVISFLYV